ncbi:MAG: type II secretion system secretin GspD [Gammaproteobacteria bacterium]
MRRILLGLLFSLIPATLVFAAAAINAENNQEQQNRRLWNLQDVDIRTVIEQVARETGKSFIIDPSVNGKATIVSNKELTPEELYQVFLSVLQVLGFAAVPSGDVIKIVPDNNAKHLALPFAGSGQGPDNLVVSVVPVNHVGVAALVPVLRNLVSQQGHLAAYAPSNVIIVADREDNVARLTEIIQRIDREETDGAEVVLLEHATASEVVATLNNIVTANRGANGGTGPVALAADDRSNTVIVSGDRNQRLKLRALVAQLDVPRNEGNTEVIYLEYQRAEDMVPVLSNVLTSYFGNTIGGSNAPVSQAAASRVNANATRPASTSSSSGGSSGYGGEGFSGFQGAERQAAGAVVGPYGVQAEPNTNALIVTAPPTLMRGLKSVIARLDVRRAQVLVEAVIAEVSADRANEFGIEWAGGGALIGGQNWGANGFLNEYQAELDSFDILDPNGTPVNPGTGLTVGIIHEGSIRFLLHALSSDTSANVLATPSVIAMDNSEATISVGEVIPYETGSYTTSTTGEGSEGPYSTFDYREVGIQLVIKPQISKGDTIQLDIMQRADSILNSDTAQPTTNNRMITTRVIVDSDDILVLGGLIETQESDSIQKIPFFGDIPIIGKAFSNTVTQTTKTNLMVFIRPSIMRDAAESNRITNQKYNFIRDQQILGDLDLPPDPREADLLPWKGDRPEALPLPSPFD